MIRTRYWPKYLHTFLVFENNQIRASIRHSFNNSRPTVKENVSVNKGIFNRENKKNYSMNHYRKNKTMGRLRAIRIHTKMVRKLS